MAVSVTVSYFGPNEVSKELFESQLIHAPPGVLGVDIETVSLKERFPVGFSIAVSPEESWYFRTYPETDREAELVRPLLNDPRICKVYHNAIFDMRVAPLIYDIDRTNFVDTNVMARLLGYTETELSVLSLELFMEPIESVKAKMKETGAKTTLQLDQSWLAAACASHSRMCLRLYHEFFPKVDQDYLGVEMRAIPILIDMSQRGLQVHQGDRAELEKKLRAEVDYYRSICVEHDFNPGSPMQVGYILAKRGSFLPFTKSKRQYKTDDETLEFLDDPLAQAVLAYRHASKLLGTYIAPLAEEDRIYTEYNLDAVVGRVSSARHNLQNIPGPDPDRALLPEGCRYIFVPDSGVYTTGDFSQEHLRILAYFSEDRNMLSVYEHGEFGGDIHLRSAHDMGVTRKIAKTVNYAIPYGADARTIAMQLKIRDERKASKFVDSWFEAYPDAAYWIKCAKEQGLRDSWSLPTLFGRRIRIPEEYKWNGELDRESMGRKAVNYPILGSDGEVMKRALIKCEDELLPLAVTVHDSITCDGDITFPVHELAHMTPVSSVMSRGIPFEVKKTLRWE